MDRPDFHSYQDSPKILRKKCLEYRKSLSTNYMAGKFKEILKNLISFEKYQNSEHILGYCGKISSGEFDTNGLLYSILDSKQLYLPKSIFSTRSLDIFNIASLSTDIELGMYNILEPRIDRCKKSSIEDIQMILVPGSVFDRSGGRYGYGAGYYDGLLNNFEGITVALALDDLVMDFSLQLHSRDVKLQYIITEKMIYG